LTENLTFEAWVKFESFDNTSNGITDARMTLIDKSDPREINTTYRFYFIEADWAST